MENRGFCTCSSRENNRTLDWFHNHEFNCTQVDPYVGDDGFIAVSCTTRRLFSRGTTGHRPQSFPTSSAALRIVTGILFAYFLLKSVHFFFSLRSCPVFLFRNKPKERLLFVFVISSHTPCERRRVLVPRLSPPHVLLYQWKMNDSD